MGTKRRKRAPSLADALFTPVQQRVLGLLFGQPERRFQGAEVIRLATSGTGAVHRLLRRLADAGLVTVTAEGKQKYYRANPRSPVYAELHGLALKTSGLVEPIRRALARAGSEIEVAFIYGSVARGSATSRSDVDLLVVSDQLTYPDLIELLQPVETALARPITPTVLTRNEWRAKRSQPDAFVARVAKGPTITVLGDAHGIA